MNRGKRLLLAIVSVVCIAGASEAAYTYYSPLIGVPLSQAGSPRLEVRPIQQVNAALAVTATEVVGGGDWQWVVFPLPVRGSRIKGLRICYKINTAAPGTTYISTVRLTQVTDPTGGLVLLEEHTGLTSTTDTCYDVPMKTKKVKGAITLSLKMVFGSTQDSIWIGMIRTK